MTKDAPYNGWTNRATWLLKLWIDNDEPTYRYWLAVTEGRKKRLPAVARELQVTLLANDLQQAIHRFDYIPAGFYRDCNRDDRKAINYTEVATSLLED